MLRKTHYKVSALAVMAGLASVLICQSHMAADVAGSASPHATRQNAAHSHHGEGDGSEAPRKHGHEHENATDDLCCLIHAGEIKPVDADSVPLAAVAIVTPPGVGPMFPELPAIGSRVLTHKPPGTLTPLQQSSVLLI